MRQVNSHDQDPIKATYDIVVLVTAIWFLVDMHVSFGEAYCALESEGSILVGIIVRQSPLGKVYEQRKRDN